MRIGVDYYPEQWDRLLWESDADLMQQLPTVYRSLVGAYIEEYDPIGYDNAAIRLSDDSVYKCRQHKQGTGLMLDGYEVCLAPFEMRTDIKEG